MMRSISQLAFDLQARIERELVRVAPAAPSSHRPPDVYFSHPDVSEDALLKMLVAMQPSVLFVSAEPFDPEDLDSEDINLRSSARAHADEIYRVTVIWAVDGLLLMWLVTAPWYEELQSETEIAEYQAQGLDQVERELRFERARTAHSELMALVLASPEFRAASTSRRTAEMKLVMVANKELVEDLLFPRDFEKRVRTEAATEVARWEHDLAADDGAVLRVAGAIRGLRTQRDKRSRTADTLRLMADGWSLTQGFIDLVLSRAEALNERRS
ncbi:hypothetical protein QNO21_10165 [Microbacterium sp. zg-Y818]|uniref:hypothetical protein n=1 Tax=unclassified Microbacterium TaxID=2609290 RepID=UPI00214BB0AC|nr:MULTISPECIES: hypothetical protein [unclassified Microbacterium]MCR2799490.1 hypothetical protein [Microbacterium sp. zg.Y818]WIM21487.1 hypothetical protein QNO21_10165 [Microbacterium sp. zg-Y818]